MGRFERVVAPTSVRPACVAAHPVSEAAGGTGCVCGITGDLISAAQNPSTLAAFCFDDEGYRTCPTWRADKHEIWASKTIKDLLNSRGDLTRGHPEDREREAGLSLALEAQERDEWLSDQERGR